MRIHFRSSNYGSNEKHRAILLCVNRVYPKQSSGKFCFSRKLSFGNAALKFKIEFRNISAKINPIETVGRDCEQALSIIKISACGSGSASRKRLSKHRSPEQRILFPSASNKNHMTVKMKKQQKSANAETLSEERVCMLSRAFQKVHMPGNPNTAEVIRLQLCLG